MKKYFLLISVLIISASVFSQSNDENLIRSVLKEQTIAWNKGNIDGFMKSYWQNDSLMFIGKSAITYGWKNTLDNYKKHYPDTASMGKLDFTIVQLNKLSNTSCFVVGKWHLQRSIGDLSGYFSLLFKKINSLWVIVADHSS